MIGSTRPLNGKFFRSLGLKGSLRAPATKNGAPKAQERPSPIPEGIRENPLVKFVAEQSNTTAYKIGVEGSFALGVLAFIDAGWSGDWVRIGAISPEVEQMLRDFTPVLVGGHLLEAAVAYWLCTEREWPAQDKLFVTLKTALAGTVVLVEAAFAEPPSIRREPF